MDDWKEKREKGLAGNGRGTRKKERETEREGKEGEAAGGAEKSGK